MTAFKHVFFDLDHTLWDFETNSKETLRELYDRHNLQSRGIRSFDSFHKIYLEVNSRFWTLYRLGKVSKKTLRTIRFSSTLQRFGIEDEDLNLRFGDDYLEISPYKTGLFPNCHKVLTYLKEKGYSLHIITNGFEEVQKIKMREANLDQYFLNLITSEKVQARKPNPLIFEHAYDTTGAKPNESIMIGDNLEADIEGAKNAGMSQVFFNPHGNKHSAIIDYEIKDLIELQEIL